MIFGVFLVHVIIALRNDGKKAMESLKQWPVSLDSTVIFPS